jgi:hypothetical protein
MTPTLGLIAGAVLLIVLFLYTFWPENAFAARKEKSQLDFLFERKEQIYDNLRDLNFEHRAGKYPEEDFVKQRSILEAEAEKLLAEIDRLQKA